MNERETASGRDGGAYGTLGRQFALRARRLGVPMGIGGLVISIISLGYSIYCRHESSSSDAQRRAAEERSEQNQQQMAAELSELKQRCFGDEDRAEVTSKPLLGIFGWTGWGGIHPRPTESGEVAFEGETAGAAGYTLSSSLLGRYSGKTIVVSISGAERSSFRDGQLFKLEANGVPLAAKAAERVCARDADYVCGEDGDIAFSLPAALRKLEFVFWNAQLAGFRVASKVVE